MRVVLDTNQLVAALVRPPELTTLLMARESARFVPIASPALIDEYQHVLAYPEIADMVYPELRRAFQSHLFDDLEIVMPPETPRLGRDPDDDKVIAVAIYGLADYVVSVDQDLWDGEIVKHLEEWGIGVLSGDQLVRLLDTR
jgi:putative PIN family toxin of toxin-antitoxin system